MNSLIKNISWNEYINNPQQVEQQSIYINDKNINIKTKKINNSLHDIVYLNQYGAINSININDLYEIQSELTAGVYIIIDEQESNCSINYFNGENEWFQFLSNSNLEIATETQLGGVKPVNKTTGMIQSVGIDSEGRLWTNLSNTLIETKNIYTNSWSELSNSAPYNYKTTLTISTPILLENTVELFNNQPILFSQYAFAISSVEGQTATIISIGKPDHNISLTFGISGYFTREPSYSGNVIGSNLINNNLVVGNGGPSIKTFNNGTINQILLCDGNGLKWVSQMSENDIDLFFEEW